ncbi:MAG: hypothetical protein EOO42_12950 [Flavobacteriales bacterium]|nr:MAG: hypothetical protein EOO42_12950 [Flavobacteriales bacterium]
MSKLLFVFIGSHAFAKAQVTSFHQWNCEAFFNTIENISLTLKKEDREYYRFKIPELNPG